MLRWESHSLWERLGVPTLGTVVKESLHQELAFQAEFAIDKERPVENTSDWQGAKYKGSV